MTEAAKTTQIPEAYKSMPDVYELHEDLNAHFRGHLDSIAEVEERTGTLISYAVQRYLKENSDKFSENITFGAGYYIDKDTGHLHNGGQRERVPLPGNDWFKLRDQIIVSIIKVRRS